MHSIWSCVFLKHLSKLLQSYCEIVNPDVISIDYNVDPKKIIRDVDEIHLVDSSGNLIISSMVLADPISFS